MPLLVQVPGQMPVAMELDSIVVDNNSNNSMLYLGVGQRA
jgi:hypothetical protein